MSDLKFNSEYLNNYLKMVEDSESPRIFHVWSALFGLSAALGRRCHLPFGTFDIFPNQYVLLIGTPGTRKSTAASLSKKLLRKSTNVRFSPSDTGGQRQGLVLALEGPKEDVEKEYMDGLELGSRNADSLMSLTQLNEITNIPDEEADAPEDIVADKDKHAIVHVASEFSRVIGQNNTSMLDFLGERYDGEDYEYQTRQSHIKLENTLINMLACTTPTSLNLSMPPAAGGQGFLSRIILVYGAKKYKKVARPVPPDSLLVSSVKSTLREAYYSLGGEFRESDAAAKFCTDLYDYDVGISDARFQYYLERRFTHLIKLAMALAASRESMQIEVDDYEEAHRILRATEHGMPEALGEFGMNPLAAIKQEILEQLRASQGPLTLGQLVAMFHREAKTSEITEVITDLVRIDAVKANQLKNGERVFSAKYNNKSTEEKMLSILAGESE